MKNIINIKVSDIFDGFPDFEKQQPIVHKEADKPRKLSLKETNIFHKKKHRIMKTILGTLDSDETIYGARALNVRLPSHLDRHTKDADIFTSTPYKEAREAEQALDTMMGFDAFYVTPAEHPGTVKVIAHATDETYVDYTRTPKGLRREKIGSFFYPTIPTIKTSLKKTLSDPTAIHRHPKDQDALNRINIWQRRMF
jgi:hypothetical protein